MTDDPIDSADIRLVWDCDPGTLLRATIDLHMNEDPEETRVFTAGKLYRVIAMHPIARKPYVRVENDHGDEHFLQGEHLRRWFRRAQ